MHSASVLFVSRTTCMQLDLAPLLLLKIESKPKKQKNTKNTTTDITLKARRCISKSELCEINASSANKNA